MEKITSFGIFDVSPYLIEQFQGTDVQKLLQAVNPQFQALEDAITELYTDIWLDTAVGASLDVLGVHLDVDRGTYDDTTYRKMMKIKIAVLRKAGTASAFLTAGKAFYDTLDVHYEQINPGTICLFAGIPPAQIGGLKELIGDIAPTGVQLQNSSYSWFVFDDGSQVADDQGVGFIVSDENGIYA